MKILRQFFLVAIFTFFVIISTLSVGRHYYLGGSKLNGKEEVFNFLSELLPNAYHLIKNNGISVENLLVESKKDINPKNFNVPGLYPYLTEDGWVILDQTEKSRKIIPIEWEKVKKDYLKYNKAEKIINSKYAAAPINPIKIGKEIIFHLGSVLFKYDTSIGTFKVYEGHYHHSIELFQDSLLYACSFGMDTLPNWNDAIMIMNLSTMKPVFEKSISEILVENNYHGLLYGTSNIQKRLSYLEDIIHLNDIQPIRKKTNFAEVGDVLISMRHLSTIMLYRPQTNKVLWLSQGPWFNQHDADVLNENEIGVYNNNYVRGIGFYKNQTSHIGTYNFKTQKYGTLHKETFEKYNIKSEFSSRFEILDNGNMFVEDSPSGTNYLINPEGELIARKSFHFKNNSTSMGVWARPYTSKPY
jgi:hypothetical protein